MKKIIFTFFFTLVLTVVHSQTVWTKELRKTFMENCVPAARESVSEKKAIEYCKCALSKIEQEHPNPALIGNLPPEEIQRLASFCLHIIEGKEPEEELRIKN